MSVVIFASSLFGVLIGDPHLLSMSTSKMVHFHFFHITMKFSELQRLNCSTRHNIAIGLKNPLCEFISFPSSRAKDATEYFLIMRKRGLVISKITPIIPLELTEVGNVALFTKGFCVRVTSTDFEVITGSKIVNSHSLF